MNIHTVPSHQNIWVVRCEHGDYFQHFRTLGLAAIGHLNDDAKGKIEPQILADSLDERLDKAFKRLIAIEGNTKASVSSRLSQVRRFVDEISIGDLVVTLSSYSRLMVGRVISNAYFDDRPLLVELPSDDVRSYPLLFGLKRKINWGPIVERKELPQATRRALNGNMTVFSIGLHGRAIRHLLYPAFEDGIGLHTTINIKQKKDLDNFSIATLFRYLSQAEALAEAAASLDEESFSEEALLQAYKQKLTSGKFVLTSKAQFMSEGDVWSTLGKSAVPLAKTLFQKHPRRYLYFVTALTVLGGNTQLGFPGLIDKQMISDGVIATVNIVRDVAHKLWDDSNGPEVAEKIKPGFPSFDTSALNDTSKDEKQIEKKGEKE